MGWHERQIPVGSMLDCLSHNVKCLLHGALMCGRSVRRTALELVRPWVDRQSLLLEKQYQEQCFWYKPQPGYCTSVHVFLLD